MTSVEKDDEKDKEARLIARAKLREAFLLMLIELTGQSCSILSYEATTLNATFAGWNTDGTEILVKNLETPSNVIMNSAILRIPDILTIKFDEPVVLP